MTNITLLDQNFEVMCAPIDAFTSLSYSDWWDDDGEFAMVLSNDYLDAFSAATYVSIVTEVTKKGETTPRKTELIYEIETIKSTDDLKVTGRNLNCMFDRIVIPVMRVQGKLEAQIRALVTAYAINGDQRIQNLELGTEHGYMRSMDALTPRGSLGEFLYTELPKRGFTWHLTFNHTTGKIVFDITQGLDRTQDQDVNETALFSTSEGNIENVEYTKSTREFFNYALVDNEDENNPQVVTVDMSYGDPVRAFYVSGSGARSSEDELGDLLVMVGRSGYIGTSADGKTFTQKTSGTTINFWAIDYRNGRFIAGGDSGNVAISLNGEAWTVVATGSAYAIEGSNYLDGMYFAFTSAGGIGYSYDAYSWFPATMTARAKIVNAVQTSRKMIAYCANTAGVYKQETVDGTVWTDTLIPVAGTATSRAILRTAILGKRVVGVGFTYDGATYTPLSVVSEDEGETNTANVITSFAGKRFLDLAVGAGLFVACGQTSNLSYSYDGYTWFDCTPADNIDYISIAFDGAYFYAYGYSVRKVSISADGKNWTNYAITGVTQNPDAVTLGTSSYTESLRQIGANAIQAQRVVEEIDGDIIPNKPPLIGIDCDIGDIVDVAAPERGILATKRLYGWQWQIEKDRNVLVPKFGEPFLSLRRFIKNEVSKRT